MMSIEAVLPAIGGIGIRLIATVVRFAVTAGTKVGGGVAPTGRLAWAGPLRTVCVVHDGVGAAVASGAAVAGGAAADGAATGALGAPHEIVTRAALRTITAARAYAVM